MRHIGLVAVIAAVAACGKYHQGAASTQVVARVNSKEITVHQLNGALKQAGAGGGDSTQVLEQAVLDRLITQEILVQQAQAAKLDQDPSVVQAIESAKRTILASAYLQRRVADLPKPADRDVDAYFNRHPEFFSGRRVYVYRSIVVQGSPADLKTAEQMLASGKDLDATLGYLRGQKLEFIPKTLAKGDEEIAVDERPRFAALKEGEIATFAHPDGLEIVKLITAKPEPIDEFQARPFIEKFLREQQRNARAAEDIKTLRAAASIQYTGEIKPLSAGPVKPSQDNPTAARDLVTKGIAAGIH
jgi:EpsD family peptidyl-prolyl cis-trans isomerase